MSDQAKRPAWDDRQAALPVILDDFERLHALVLAEIGHPLPQHLRDFARDWLDTATESSTSARAPMTERSSVVDGGGRPHEARDQRPSASPGGSSAMCTNGSPGW